MFDLSFFKIVYTIVDWPPPAMGVMNAHQTALHKRTHASTRIELAERFIAISSESDRLLYEYIESKYVPYFGLPSCEKIYNRMARYSSFPGGVAG